MDAGTSKKRKEPGGSGGGSGKGSGSSEAKSVHQNAKQRRVAKQVMAVQPVTNPDALARTINVEQFVEARKFEIDAMENALKNATEFTGNMRIFQTLPRHMRRRAASYNVKRLPQRFRQRAIDQVSNHGEKPQPMKKSRRAKRRPGAVFEMFQKRSKEDKRWLDTHLWHAKRMHMGHKWGFMLALHRNDKSTKSNYRASQHTSTLHDASYYHCLQLQGSVTAISAVMGRVCDPTFMSVGAKRFLQGERQGSTFIHRMGEYPSGAVAPASFFWIANEALGDEERILWVWVHPSAANEALATINESISCYTSHVTATNLRSQLTRFELSGPRAHAALSLVLNINASCSITSSGRKTWKELEPLRTPASLPPGVILGLSIHDPRITFPPKKEAVLKAPASSAALESLNNLFISWPKGVSKTNLHEQTIRSQFLRKSPTDATLNAKRSNKLPGQPLDPMDGGPAVPILLVQRNTNTSSDNTSEFVNGWDVILPAGPIAVDLWKSLVFAGSHSIGIQDRRRICFETGVASFPEDYPETAAHVAWAREVREEKKGKWERRPKDKRINYDKLNVLDPFVSHFSRLVAVERGADGVELAEVDVLHAPKLIGIAREALKAHADLEAVTKMCADSIVKMRPEFQMGKSLSLRNTFVRCRLAMMGRGVAEEHGIVYLASQAEIEYWTDFLKRRRPEGPVNPFDFSQPPPISKEDEIEPVLDKFPGHESIIGFITNGGFSMAEGQGIAVGSCLLRGLLKAREMMGKDQRAFVLVRGPRGRVCRPAKFELIC
ncbi:ribonucleases P/MRP protein subunit POP1-domain-containing protein [Chytriomyces sp. MP71]|nr:ribonucleases P/MRP protein subunit POP1-domain-containing protein [Chytriomyces sp. MP71]